MEEISAEILEDKFSENILERISGETPRKNFWTKSLEELLERIPEGFMEKSLKELLEKSLVEIPVGVLGGKPRRISWKKFSDKYWTKYSEKMPLKSTEKF